MGDLLDAVTAGQDFVIPECSCASASAIVSHFLSCDENCKICNEFRTGFSQATALRPPDSSPLPAYNAEIGNVGPTSSLKRRKLVGNELEIANLLVSMESSHTDSRPFVPM